MCEYKGRSYSDRDTIRDNCNTCSCQVTFLSESSSLSSWSSSCATLPTLKVSKLKTGCMEVLCSTNQCLVEEAVLQEVWDTDFMQALNHHHLMIHHHNRHHHYHHHPYHHHQHFQVRDGEEGGLYSWRPANYSNFWGRFVKIMIIIQKYKMRKAR